MTNNFTVELWVNPLITYQLDVEAKNGADGTVGQRYAIFPSFGGLISSGNSSMGISVGTNGVGVYEHAEGYMPALLT